MKMQLINLQNSECINICKLAKVVQNWIQIIRVF